MHHRLHKTQTLPQQTTSTADSKEDVSDAYIEIHAMPRALSSEQKAADESRDRSNTGFIVAVVGSIIAALVIVTFIIYILFRRHRRSKISDYASTATSEESVSEEKLKIDPKSVKPILVSADSKLRQRAESNVYEDVETTGDGTAARPARQSVVRPKDISVYCPMDGSGCVRSAVVGRPAMERPASSDTYIAPIDGALYLAMNQSAADLPPAYTNCPDPNDPQYANQDAEMLEEEEEDEDVLMKDGKDAEYDSPRPANIYSEIPDAEAVGLGDDDVENIYESFDQVLDKKPIQE